MGGKEAKGSSVVRGAVDVIFLGRIGGLRPAQVYDARRHFLRGRQGAGRIGHRDGCPGIKLGGSTGASRNKPAGASRNKSAGTSRNKSAGASRNKSAGTSRDKTTGASRDKTTGASGDKTARFTEILVAARADLPQVGVGPVVVPVEQGRELAAGGLSVEIDVK
jgi:hypothetical protein